MQHKTQLQCPGLGSLRLCRQQVPGASRSMGGEKE